MVRSLYIIRGTDGLLWEILGESHHRNLKFQMLRAVKRVKEVRTESFLVRGEVFLGVGVILFCKILKTTQWNSEPCMWGWGGMFVEELVYFYLYSISCVH